MSEHAEEAHGSGAEQSHSGGGHGGAHGHGGGGGGHEEAHEGAPEWLISFADNVTLMMGFFVILLALNLNTKAGSGGGADASTPGANESSSAALDWAISVREAFNNPVNAVAPRPADALLAKRMRQRAAPGDGRTDGVRGTKPDSQSLRPSDFQSLCGAVSFEDGSAQLTRSGQAVVEDTAAKIKGLRFILDLRGHASAAEAYGADERAMRLCFDRSLSVRSALTKLGIDERQLRIVICGDNDRVTPLSYKPQEQRTNQRVEIVVTQELVREYNATDGASEKREEAGTPHG